MTEATSRRKRLHPAARGALDTLGAICVVLGTIGIFVPFVWPTFEFYLVAVLCFLKTRPGAVRPLLRVPKVGKAVIWFLRWRPFGGGKKRRTSQPAHTAESRDLGDNP